MKTIIKKVANSYGVSVEEVENEIKQAMLISKRSNTKKAQDFWGRLERISENPSVKVYLNAMLLEVLPNINKQGRN